jgi:hypothetical protein
VKDSKEMKKIKLKEIYKECSNQEIERYLRRVIRKLQENKDLEIEPEVDNYGSGYASYIDIFSYKKGKKPIKIDNYLSQAGISIYISKLAPYAVYGFNEKTRSSVGGSYGMLFEIQQLYVFPEDKQNLLLKSDWDFLTSFIIKELTSLGFVFPGVEFLSNKLPSHTKIPTLFRDKQFTCYDSFFHWED